MITREDTVMNCEQKRERLNQYWRNRRQRVRVAKLTAEAKAVDPNLFINKPYPFSWWSKMDQNCGGRLRQKRTGKNWREHGRH
jgi:hypothetical protein